MDEARMFTVAPSRLCMVANYDWRVGWSLRVTRDGCEGERALWQTHEGLSTAELVDVAGEELLTLLGLRDTVA